MSNASDYLTSPFGNYNYGQTPNPWFSVANQFLPRNLHDVIRWSKYITTQSPTTTEVIRKLSSYPITDFLVDTKNKETEEKYRSIFKMTRLRQNLQEIGFGYHTIGNVFISIYFPISRSLVCPECKTEFNAKRAPHIKFEKYKFKGTCTHCNNRVEFERVDRKSLNLKDMNIVQWDPLNIVVNSNPITGQCEYYYSIPNEIRRRIISGDMLFLASTPWSFVESVQRNTDYKFDTDGIYHLKVPSLTTVQLNGIAVPPLISLFSLVFYQQTLRRANESIATEFLNPLRVIYPSPNGSADPSVSMSLSGFKGRMEQALRKHKRDQNHILVSPVPVGYGTVTGEGRALLVNQEIQQAEDTMLMSLGVSRELLSGTTNWTSSTVGLRLLENSMSSYVAQMDEFLEWMFDRVSTYVGIETCKVSLREFKLIDDATMQQTLAQLATNGKISMSKFFESIGEDYNDDIETQKEDHIRQELAAVEAELELRKRRVSTARKASSNSDEGSSEYAEFYKGAVNKAMEMFPLGAAEAELQLMMMDAEDPAMSMIVRELLQTVHAAEAQEQAAQQQAAEMQAQQSGAGGKPAAAPKEKPSE